MTAYGFHPEASVDIDDIWNFIAADNIDATNRVAEDVLDAIDLLVAFPHHGYRRPELTSRPLRFQLLREYVIAYAPEKKPLWVVAVFHGRRNPSRNRRDPQGPGVGPLPCSAKRSTPKKPRH